VKTDSVLINEQAHPRPFVLDSIKQMRSPSRGSIIPVYSAGTNRRCGFLSASWMHRFPKTHGLHWPCNSIVPSVRWVGYWLVSGEIPVMGGMNGVERRSWTTYSNSSWETETRLPPFREWTCT